MGGEPDGMGSGGVGGMGRDGAGRGRMVTWMGAIQKGKSPAVDSIRTPKKRSSEPKIARWSMIGRSLVPSAEVYSSSNRSGRLKSAWMVEHCQVRPMASLILMSIFGP